MKTIKRLNISIGIGAIVMIFQIANCIGLFTLDIKEPKYEMYQAAISTQIEETAELLNKIKQIQNSPTRPITINKQPIEDERALTNCTSFVVERKDCQHPWHLVTYNGLRADCYLISEEKMDIFKAHKFCNLQNGTLAEPRSDIQTKLLNVILEDKFNTKYWIGLSDHKDKVFGNGTPIILRQRIISTGPVVNLMVNMMDIMKMKIL